MMRALTRTQPALAKMVAVSLLVGFGVAGCSNGSGDSTPDASTESSAGVPDESMHTPSPSVPPPAGVEVTEPGTELDLRETATIAVPGGEQTGALTIRVDRVREVPASVFRGWLNPSLRGGRNYFVYVRLSNVGEVNLGGRMVPLWMGTDQGTTVPLSRFDGPPFKPCPSGSLPPTFRPGAKLATCLVYLIPKPGKFVNLGAAPEAGVEPVLWSGKVVTDSRRSVQ